MWSCLIRRAGKDIVGTTHMSPGSAVKYRDSILSREKTTITKHPIQWTAVVRNK